MPSEPLWGQVDRAALLWHPSSPGLERVHATQRKGFAHLENLRRDLTLADVGGHQQSSVSPPVSWTTHERDT